MSLDVRTRLARDVRPLTDDESLDLMLPQAVEVHGDLAARGVEYLELPALGIEVDGRGVTLAPAAGTLALRPGVEGAAVVAVLSADALSDLLQDTASTMGLAMTSQVKITAGSINDW